MVCKNCGKYFELYASIDGGITCSERCSKEYLAYLLNNPKTEW